MTSKIWEAMNDLEMITSKIVSARQIIDASVQALQEHDYDKSETLMMAAYEFLEYYLKDFDEKFKIAWHESVVKSKGHVKKESHFSCDKDDPSPECQKSWNDFWEENYYPEEVDDGMRPWGHSDLEYTGSTVSSEHSLYYYDYTRNDPTRLNPFAGIIYESPDSGKTIYGRKPGETERVLIKEDKVTKWVLPVEECKDADTDETEYFVSFPDDLLQAANLREGDQIEWVDRGDGSYILRKVKND